MPDSRLLKLQLQLESASRLDLALLAALRPRYPELSRGTLKIAFREKRIRYRGQVAPPSLELPAGEHEVECQGFDPAQAGSPPQALAAPEPFLPVIYEDDEILILHKLSGVPSVPQSPDEWRTAVGSALALHPELHQVGPGGYEPAILHRLDTGTSGLIAFARTREEHSRLRSAWQSGGVRKGYRALIQCTAPHAQTLQGPEPQTIRLALAHDSKSSKRMIALHGGERHFRGRPLPAVTHLRSTTRVGESLWDAEIEIETGVMHQIRCHLAAAGWPIQGDPIYGGAPSSRLWLHASWLELPLRDGARIRVQSRLPEGWPS